MSSIPEVSDPAEDKLEGLGTFKDCAQVVEATRNRFAPLNARALCCPTCSMKAGGDAAA
ncbi:hypothetical protein SAMN05444413_10977 [Roseivivax marinus]|nr:hypothetical protein SAMN05444413_10977 [Roseivivax marinus]